jgi:hypothetical protein
VCGKLSESADAEEDNDAGAAGVLLDVGEGDVNDDDGPCVEEADDEKENEGVTGVCAADPGRKNDDGIDAGGCPGDGAAPIAFIAALLCRLCVWAHTHASLDECTRRSLTE